jgi:signal transduction histidine kinase
MARLVDSLSFLTKADAQMIPLALHPVALDELLREAADDAEVLGAASGIIAELGECAAVQIRGDRHRLRQVLLILCDNAVKYNLRDGTGRIRLSLHRQGEDAVMEIGNTGPELSPGEQTKVFDRFYRGSSEQSRAIEGSGLGLSIAQWLVHQHGGSIACTSHAGETRFIITILAVP